MIKKMYQWFMWRFQYRQEYNAGRDWGMSRMFSKSGEDQRLRDYIATQPDSYFMQGASRAVLDWKPLTDAPQENNP